MRKAVIEKMKKHKFLNNQRGIAMVEMLPLLFIFIILFGLTFGLWASIHSGTLQSIAARHYAFQVLNNRTHFIYHRDTMKINNNKTLYYEKNGKRFFAIVEAKTGKVELIPEIKEINLFNQGVLSITGDNKSQKAQTNPIKLRTGYGICIDFDCGK